VKTHTINYTLENPAIDQTEQSCNLSTGSLTGIVSINLPFAAVPESISISGNDLVSAGSIQFKIQCYIGAAWVDTALTATLTTGQIRTSAINLQNFYYAQPANTTFRLVYTTDHTYAPVTTDWFIVVTFAM